MKLWMTSSERESSYSSVPHAEPWSIADVIDFEFLLSAPEVGDEDAARKRARTWLDRQNGPRYPGGDASERRAVFREWLEARRATAGTALPGASFRAGYQTLLAVAAVLGLALGATLTATLLHYKGAEPVNVTVFLAWTVGLQILILAGGLLFALLRRTTRAFSEWQPLRWTIAGLLWLFSAGLRRLPGEQRERVRAVLGLIEHKRGLYGSLALWPLLVVTQVFGVCYNIGILATLLGHVATTDLAFGWQSTLQASPEQVHTIVRELATPWAWFAPNAYPTLAQIEGSRFQYAQGVQSLAPDALAAWWPFLCHAVTFYGLLVRVFLLVLALAKMRGALRRLPFDHHACNTLWRHLLGTFVETQGGEAGLTIPDRTAAAGPRQHASGTALVLVTEDVQIEQAAVAEKLRANFGWEVAERLPAEIAHPTGNAEILKRLAADAGKFAGVVVLMRAKRSPIKAIALFLRKVAEVAGPKTELVVLLVGRKQNGGFTAVADEEAAHWHNFAAIYGLRLGIEKWSDA
jgi:hypothetical protein